MPAGEWAAEVAIDAGIVRRVLRAQFPELTLSSLRLLGEGWDNSVWLVDGSWLFRFPRRELAVPPVERQVRLLPPLRPRLPLPVPQPVFVGAPSDAFRWPFFGTPFLPGREIADVSPDDQARARAARPLAEFLRALHAPGLLALAGVDTLPVDPNRRADMTFRVERTRARIAELRELGLWEAPPEVEQVLEDALELPAPAAPVLVHGDLHLRHLLIADDGSPTAVIDWDDICRADPAVDLPLYWSFLPPAARPAFLDAYPATAEQLLRARVVAVFLCGALAVYGHHETLPALVRESVASIERTLTD